MGFRNAIAAALESLLETRERRQRVATLEDQRPRLAFGHEVAHRERLATALLFTWLTDYLHITRATAWPGADTLLLVGLIAWGMHRIAAAAGRALGATADGIHGTDGWDRIATHVTTLLAQLPVVLIYGLGLARQIAL